MATRALPGTPQHAATNALLIGVVAHARHMAEQFPTPEQVADAEAALEPMVKSPVQMRLEMINA